MLIMNGITDHLSWATLSLLNINKGLYESNLELPFSNGHPIVK